MRYPVARPDLGRTERRLLLEAFDENAISSVGRHVAAFEAAFARTVGVPHAVAVSSGTAALHLALAALRIGPGDEVVVPALTFVAPANAVRYTGARLVLAEVDPDSWTLTAASVERVLTRRTRAIVAVHLYGVPADLDGLRALARRRGLALVEDAAEALGARWRGRPVGGLGTLGCFSLFGNKVVTTGEGGVVVTSSAPLARRLRLLRNQAMSPRRRYWHGEIGFNYRMTALQAAVGLGQLARFETLVARRRRIASAYRAALADLPGYREPTPPPGGEAVPWLFTLARVPWTARARDALLARLARAGIESRPVFHALPALPPFRAAGFPVARRLAACGFSLPTYTALRSADVAVIARAVRSAWGGRPAAR